MELTVPVVFVMREMLGLVQTAQQARTILRTQAVTVNGKHVYDTNSAVGFMDVITIGGKQHRIIISAGNVLSLIDANESFTLQKIVGKTTIRKKQQLNCATGRNFIVAKDEYSVGDCIAVGFDGKITAHYPLKVGASVLLTGGSHIGVVGTVASMNGHDISIAVNGNTLHTAKEHAYVIGKEKPAISL
jgi:small subunit ribosomal protein S4e